MTDTPPILKMPADDSVESPFRVVRTTCFHSKFTLHEDSRTVTCGVCGEGIDPWTALHIIARDSTHWTEAIHRVRRELDDLGRRREALKNQVQNLKAQVRRWEAKRKEAR